jgi:calcium/calmodulin-dependent protein kinase I
MTVRTTADAEMTAMLSVLSGFERHFDDYYKIEERLHAGAYGTVYRVTGKQTHKSFAAKIIPRRKLRKVEEKDMMAEADILRDLCGMEHVVEFVDFFACDDYFTIVQTLAKGGDVFERIAKRQLYSEQDARSVAIKLLQTIKKLHDRDIIHRDVKLENILLNTNDNTSILLADFGFATYLPENGFVTRRCGTPAYCAPEVWKREAYGKGCDMWSVGCALYILFSGSPPFAGRDNQETFRMACEGDVRFEGRLWKSVSKEAKDCIRGLLTVDPAMRWTAKEALESTWIQSGLTDALFQNLDWMPNCSERSDQVSRSLLSSVVPLNMG